MGDNLRADFALSLVTLHAAGGQYLVPSRAKGKSPKRFFATAPKGLFRLTLLVYLR
jgi:hypothetical protein